MCVCTGGNELAVIWQVAEPTIGRSGGGVLEIRGTMGEPLQEIISLEGATSPSLLTPRYGALFRSARATFTSGQPYLMLLDLSWHRVTD